MGVLGSGVAGEHRRHAKAGQVDLSLECSGSYGKLQQTGDSTIIPDQNSLARLMHA